MNRTLFSVKELSDNIEYRKLSEVATVERGKRVVKNQLSNEAGYPVYQNSLTSMGFHTEYNYDAGMTYIIGAGAAGEIGFSSEKFWAADDCFPIVCGEQVLDRYVYHILLQKQLQIKSRVRKASIPRVSRDVISNLVIPVPPLNVQQEIVMAMDTFTCLIGELSSELSVRRRQYDYYKNKLLDFSDSDVKYMSVGELFDIRNGISKEKEAFGHGKPIINFSDVYNHRYLKKEDINGLVDVSPDEISRFSAKKGDVFFTRTSETKEDIGMSSTLVDDIEDCVFSGFVLRARPKTDLLLPKFSAYFFSTKEVRKTIIRYASVTTRATTTGPKISKIMVPIIDKEEQQKLIDALDCFDCLCNDTYRGIPAEIEERQKQYEHYRGVIVGRMEENYG